MNVSLESIVESSSGRAGTAGIRRAWGLMTSFGAGIGVG
jgi:hypothetical protein